MPQNCFHISLSGQQEIDRVPLFINRSIIIFLGTFNFNISFVQSTTLSGTLRQLMERLFKLWRILNNPAIERTVVNLNTSLNHISSIFR